MINEFQLIHDYQNGMSTYKAATKYSTSPQNVSKILKRHSIQTRTKKEASALFHGRAAVLSNEQVAQDYRSGLSIAKVAEKNDCNIKTVRYILGQLDVQTRASKHSSANRFNRQNILDAKLIRQDFENGLSPSEIAKKYGCHRTTVYRLLKVNHPSEI